ncbi:hypothetical protein PR202_gb20241 [Eleusine coracana subsp. coracana]|uniref:Uncharacterized protein n=1 Tax=Eleusine coracana subsp. coracana TaxID=191504 RepID=A0AAV5FA69_ELECO|nr:hypothetical protein PR202_gb20241 [Eleusine coracana subsp. coracana]
MGKRSGNKKGKDKVILPPELPEIDDDEVVVSDEDVEFYGTDKRSADLLGIRFRSCSYVRRVTGKDEGEVERLYEERERKRRAAEALRPRREEDEDMEVDPVDALPIKTLNGELVYNNAKKARSEDNASAIKPKAKEESRDAKPSVQKDKQKEKSKNQKGYGKLQNVRSQTEVPKGNLHSEVLEEVKEELSAEELFEKKKGQLAELGMAMLEDPESNIRSLNDMLSISNDKDQKIIKLSLMSLLAVFKDIIPSYRIRQLTEKELAVEVSKEVKKTRYYEYTLIRCYKTYLQKLGKHRGEATIEAVRLIADHVKLNDCQLHPDSIEVFLSLRFDEDIRKDETEEENEKPKKNKRREEGYNRKHYLLFETYFRILEHTMSTSISRSKGNNLSQAASHPLLGPCLEGLGKFSHLIDLDFMGELIACLKKLSGYSDHQDKSPRVDSLSVSERLQCCIVAFKVWRSNLEALNVDLQDFFVQLYNLILEYRPDRDRGDVLADALKTLLWEGKQQDMLRAAAFIKRLATFALSFGSAEAIAEAKDPYLSGGLASVLWELSLLEKHYNISVSSMASNTLSMANLNPTQNPVPILNVNPLEAYRDLSIEQELSKPASKVLTLNCKRKRRNEFVALSRDVLKEAECPVDEHDLKKRLESHFEVLRGISENERLRAELNHTMSSLSMYKEYKKQKKKNMKSKTGKKKEAKV